MPKREINLTTSQELMLLLALNEWYERPMTKTDKLLYPHMKEEIEDIFKQFDADEMIKNRRE